MEQRPLCCSWAALGWSCGLESSRYLISMRWMSRCSMLRSLGRCCLGKVDLLVAGGAAEVLLVSYIYIPQLPPATPKNPPPFIASPWVTCYIINRSTVLVAVALSIFVGSGDLCWLCMVQETSLAVSSSRGPREGCLRQRALRVTHGPSWSSLTCCRRAVVSTFWGPPSGPPPPSLPLLFSLGHLGVQQQL